MSEMRECPDGAILYVRRCGWCGAYEGTVPSNEPCSNAIDDSTGECIGPHQFGPLEEVDRPTEDALRARVEELEAEAELGNVPYREAVALQKRVGELEGALTTEQKLLAKTMIELGHARKALKEIQGYDEAGDGCCPYGCDCPTIACKALTPPATEAEASHE